MRSVSQTKSPARPASAHARSCSGCCAAHADRAEHHAVPVTDDERARTRDQRQPGHAAHRVHEPGSLGVLGGDHMAVAVPHRSALGLGLGDLSAEREGAVHAVQRDEQPALIDDSDRDAQTLAAGAILGQR